MKLQHGDKHFLLSGFGDLRGGSNVWIVDPEVDDNGDVLVSYGGESHGRKVYFSLPPSLLSGLTQEDGDQVGGDHYSKMGIQPIQYIQANSLGYEEGNVIKYVSRHASKNGRQDLEKAIHYLELLIANKYPDGASND